MAATSATTTFFLPEVYGCVGDGVTNDATNLQACINAAIATGGTVALGPVNYFIGTTSITGGNDVTLLGCGYHLTTITYTGTGDAITGGSLTSVLSRCTLKGLTVAASGGAATSFTAIGVHLYNAQGCSACGVAVTGFGNGEGLRLEGGVSGSNYCSDNSLSNLNITGNEAGIHLVGNNGLNGDRCNNTLIQECVVTGTGSGVCVWIGDGHTNRVVNCDLSFAATGIQVDSHNNMETCNRFATITNERVLRADPNPGAAATADHGSNGYKVLGVDRASSVINPMAANANDHFYLGQDPSNSIHNSLFLGPLSHMAFGTYTPSYPVDLRGQVGITGTQLLLPLAQPAAPGVTPTGGTGTTSYSYVIVANCGSTNTQASAAGSTTTGVAFSSFSSSVYNALAWTLDAAATGGYTIYRTVGGTTQGKIGTAAAGVGFFNDTGLAGDGTTAPTANTTGALGMGGLNTNNVVNTSAALGAPTTNLFWGNGQILTSPTGVLAIANGGTGAASAAQAFNNLSPFTTLGDTLFGGASGAANRLAGNTGSTKQFLTQTGTGTVSAAPAWGGIVLADLPGAGVINLAAGTGISLSSTTAALGGTAITITNTVGSGVTSVTGTSPITSTGGNTPAIGINLGAHLTTSGGNLVTDATNAPGTASKIVATDSNGTIEIGDGTWGGIPIEGRASTSGVGVFGNATGASHSVVSGTGLQGIGPTGVYGQASSGAGVGGTFVNNLSGRAIQAQENSTTYDVLLSTQSTGSTTTANGTVAVIIAGTTYHLLKAAAA